jgi:ferredoxin-NADP reductase
VKFDRESSSFKQAMLALDQSAEIMAGHLAGDFVLPRDSRQKCVFIAGGIGITPFRSMIKYLLDTRQRRPIVLFYANKTVDDIVYQDIFEQAQRELGIRTVYAVTDPGRLAPSWRGHVGRITAQLIRSEVPEYLDCIYYISGPQTMVDSFNVVLREMGVRASDIKTDLFSGLV